MHSLREGRTSSVSSLTLALLMSAVLAACGGGNGGATAGSESVASVSPSDPSGGPIAESPAPGTSADVPVTPPMAEPTSTSPAPELQTPAPAPTAEAPAPAPSPAPAPAPAPTPTPTPTPLPPGALALSWESPATRADGSSGPTISGYRVYYGNAPGSYTQSVYVAGAGATGATVTKLVSGTTWYFTVAAVDADGNESNLGYEISKAL
jgi:hypothetical protein